MSPFAAAAELVAEAHGVEGAGTEWRARRWLAPACQPMISTIQFLRTRSPHVRGADPGPVGPRRGLPASGRSRPEHRDARCSAYGQERRVIEHVGVQIGPAPRPSAVRTRWPGAHTPGNSGRSAWASSARPATPSFWYVWVRCTATVFIEMKSDCAIWRFESPSPAS